MEYHGLSKAHSSHKPVSVHSNHKCIPKLHKEAEHCQNNCSIFPPSHNFSSFCHIPPHPSLTNLISRAQPRNPIRKIPQVNCWGKRAFWNYKKPSSSRIHNPSNWRMCVESIEPKVATVLLNSTSSHSYFCAPHRFTFRMQVWLEE